MYKLNDMIYSLLPCRARIQNAISIMIAVLVAIWKNRSNVEIAFHITDKMQFSQLKNLSDKTVSSQIGHILNPIADGLMCKIFDRNLLHLTAAFLLD